MSPRSHPDRRRPVRSLSWLVASAAIGCSSLTSVDTSSIVQPSSLSNPTGATALFNGAYTQFAGAFNGNPLNLGSTTISAVTASGLISDELGAATRSTSDILLDSRTISEAADVQAGRELYIVMSQARVSALAAAQTLQRVAPSARARIGEMFALAAYVELLFGELYCAGVALTVVSEGAPATYGAPLTTKQILERATADFDSALVYAADSAAVVNLARVGKARSLLVLGQYAAAATVARAVPISFVFVTDHSSAAQPNWLSLAFTNGVSTVSEKEGQNGLPFRSAGDPRVKTALLRKGIDAVTDVYALTTLSAGQSASTVLASGIEARLIEAEAAYQANPSDVETSGSGWLGILNNLRASAITPSLTALADPGSPSGRVDLLFRERAFWLFGTAHRLGDLRRLVKQYSRTAATVFPTGTYPGGRIYGADVNLTPSPTIEGRNPEYKGCLDRNA
jgi:starch-binding outer membrane protein, SusD/RagB family